MKKKSLAVNILLALSATVFMPMGAWAAEITNQGSDGGVYVNNNTFTSNDTNENSEITGFGIRAEKNSTVTLNVNNLDINVEDKYSYYSAAGGISIDNKNGNTESKITINANGNVNLINKEPVNLKDLNGIYINSGSYSTGTKYGQSTLEIDLNKKGNFVIDSFQNGMTLEKNSNVKIKNAFDITIKNNSNDGLKITPLLATSSDNVSGEINLSASNDISFINNKINGIEIRQNSGKIQLNAGRNIIFDNSNKNTDNRIGTAINMYNSHLTGEAESNIIFNAGNKIEIQGFETAISNEHSDGVKFFANSIVIKDVNTGVHLNGGINKGNDYISNVTLDASQNGIYKDSMIEITADDNAIETSGATAKDGYANLTITSKNNQIYGGNIAINATDNSSVQINGEKSYNQIIGGTEAVLATNKSTVNISGTHNVIGNSTLSNITTYDEGKETYAVHAQDGGNINITAENGGVNQITSDGFRTIYAEGQGLYDSDISISGAVQIQNNNYLSTDDNVSKIAVVASGAYSFSKGNVMIDLDGTTGNFIGGSVIAGQNGVVSINEISNTTRANEKAGSIAVLGNVFAGNNGQMTLNLGDGGYLQGRVDDYQDADSKQGIDFYNPEFSKEVTSKGTVHLTMGQGSQWAVTGQSWVTNLDGNGGVVNMTDANSDTHAVHIGTLEGNHTFVLDLDRDDHAISDMLYIADTGASSGVQTIQFRNIAGWENMEDGEKLRFATVNASESELSFVSGNSTGVAYLRDRGMNDMAFSIDNEQVNYTDETKQEENESYNGTEFSAAKPGNELIEDNYNTQDSLHWFLTKESSKDQISDAGKTVVAMSRINYSNAIYMDRLNKRMGEARYIDGDEGLWVRMRHDRIGKSDAFRSMNTMMELGYDTRVNDREDGEHRQGVAIDYMRGTADYKNVAGEGDVRRGGIWFYDTWLGNKGHYTDYVLKFGRLSNDFELYTRTLGEKVTGDYSNFVYSASAEYGRKKDLGNNWYIEPQAQIQYAHVTDADYTTSQDTHVQLDAIDSLIGRVGFRLGKDVGEKSTFYIKADVLHEFLGDQDIEARDATGLLSTTYENEGTWYDIGLGFSHQFSKGTYMYLDMEKSIGNDNEDTYQFNFGMNWKV